MMMMMNSAAKTSSSSTCSSTDHSNINYMMSASKEKEEKVELIIIPKEPLFEKTLTPSDVGKLNRLVIPKQYAERYFPPIINDSNNNENGLIMSFEDNDDEVGKLWRFRYSYWNSSQSYVLTKGWSRFVKEKRLYAGDVVLFFRNLAAGPGCLFIGWRRKNSVGLGQDNNNIYNSSLGLPMYQPPSSSTLHHAPGSSVLQKQKVVITGAGSGNSKIRRLRLFGVNLECQLPDNIDESESNHLQRQYNYQNHQY